MPFPAVPTSWGKVEEWLAKSALAVNGLLQGKSNNVDEVTLAVSPATTTVITNRRITPDTMIVLTAKTANAAGAVATLRFAATLGQITLTHAASAAADRTFAYALIG